MKSIISFFAICLIAGSFSVNTNSAEASGLDNPSLADVGWQACVTIYHTPPTKSVSCVGRGQGCITMSDCS